MEKAIFLDRDGTINVEKEYLCRKEDFEFIPGTVEALQRFQKAGYLLIIITNQSGIARGYYSEEAFLSLNGWMLGELKAKGIKIAAVYYCPHHPQAIIGKYKGYCDCRKPQLGLFMRAVQDFNIDLSISFAIGDKLRDCSICGQSACRGFLVGGNEQNEIIKDVQAGKYENIAYGTDLLSCAKKICVRK